MSNLKNAEIEITKNRIRWHNDRPFGFSPIALHGDMEYEEYTLDEIKEALKTLVNKGVFDKNPDGSYVFTRKGFVDAKREYRYLIIRKRFETSIKQGLLGVKNNLIKIVVIVIAGIILYLMKKYFP